MILMLCSKETKKLGKQVVKLSFTRQDRVLQDLLLA